MNMGTRTSRIAREGGIFSCLLLLFFLTSCSSLMTALIEPTVDNLQKQTDLDLVCQGAPAYLLMIDSMIASDPTSSNLLLLGAKSYSGYLSAMTECGYSDARIATVADKARRYGTALLAADLPIAPGDSVDSLNTALQQMTRSDVPSLFWGALAWTTWIQNQHGSPASIADLVKVERIMHRVEELDDTYQQGGVHLFFGAYYAAKPPLLGGRPDLSRIHFQRALAISHRSFLLVQTTYAATYARLTMNRKLYNTLLHEVVAFPLDRAPDNALSNQIAKREAKKLLAEGLFTE